MLIIVYIIIFDIILNAYIITFLLFNNIFMYKDTVYCKYYYSQVSLSDLIQKINTKSGH